MGKDSFNKFSSWFNTPYYHILHKKNDASEASVFLETITNYLNLPEQATILNINSKDVQHSEHLNNLGYNVTEIDLNESSIKSKQYDAVFNLFNGFGYFESDKDYLNVIKSMKANLNETGFAVIDVMNCNVAVENLIPEETRTIGQIDFKLKQYIEDGSIIKDITFEADGKVHHHQERIKIYTLKDFEALFDQADAYLLDVFGDYKLNKYRPQTSERLVMIFK
jgi:hypothetical protein